MPRRSKTVGREFQLDLVSLCNLRAAIRANRVSFPSQVPIFFKHDRPDLQRQVVLLYFVLGWNCDAIGGRYGLIRQRVQQILNTWKRRAAQTGYIQHIPAADEAFKIDIMPFRSRSDVASTTARCDSGLHDPPCR